MIMDRKKILIIDDEQRIREMYIRLLVEKEFIVRQAENAKVALQILVRENIDLILLDLKMPQVNGSETFEIIKEYEPGKKIIIASVYPIERQKQVCPQASDYFDKSHGPAVLLSKIENHLSRANPKLNKKGRRPAHSSLRSF